MSKQIFFAAAVAMATAFTPVLAVAQGSGEAADGEPSTDKDKRAKDLYLRGDRLYAEGKYEEAVAAFEEAYTLSQRPRLLYNLANTYERLGRYEAALNALRNYAPHAPEFDKDVVLKRIKSMEERAEAKRAEEAKGQADVAPPSTPKPPPEEPASTQPEQPPPARSGADPVPDGQTETPILGYTLLGVGALGIGIGTYFGLQALGARTDAEEFCPSGGLCSGQAKDSLDTDDNSSLLADIGFGVGIVSATIGLVLVLTSDSKKSQQSRIKQRRSVELGQLRAVPRAGGGEVSLVGRF